VEVDGCASTFERRARDKGLGQIKNGPANGASVVLSLGNICEPADSEYTIHAGPAEPELFSCIFIIAYSADATRYKGQCGLFLEIIYGAFPANIVAEVIANCGPNNKTENCDNDKVFVHKISIT